MKTLSSSVCTKTWLIMQQLELLFLSNHSFTEVKSSLGKGERLKPSIFVQTLGILLLIILTSCGSKSNNKSAEKVLKNSSLIHRKVKQQDKVKIQTDTLIINEQKFIQTLNSGQISCLQSIQGDTIVKSENFYFEYKFIDINKDGYKDLRVFEISNTPNQCANYLFDNKLKTFKLIENCELDIVNIKGTDFFYSYNSAGCADMNWESHLSKVENFRLVDYGYIFGQGCNYEIEKNPKVIEIYKVNNSDMTEKKLIKRLLYQKHIKEFDDKWDFIENYWIKNYKIFAPPKKKGKSLK